MKEQYRQFYKEQLERFKKIKEETSMVNDFGTWSRANKEIAVLAAAVGDDD